MKSKFNQLLAMGAMAQTMAHPAPDVAADALPRNRRFSEGGSARFPRSGKQPKNWHENRRSRRNMQKASRKRNRAC